MYLDILNSYDSKIEIQSEGNLIRASLLIADGLIVAGRSSYPLCIREFMKEARQKTKIEFLKRRLEQYYEDDPQMLQNFCKAIDDYTVLSRKRGKNKREVLIEIISKKFINGIERIVVQDIELRAENDGIKDIMPFAPCRNNVINVQHMNDKNPQYNINLASDLLISKEDYLIFDANAFDSAKHSELNNAANVPDNMFCGTSSPFFLWEEMFSMNLLMNLTPEHFKLIRENFLAGTIALRSALLNAKIVLLNTAFSNSNRDVFNDQLEKIKLEAAEFEKIEKGNELINKLTAAGIPSKKMKIILAVTSYRNLINMLKEMCIITEREDLYVQKKISNHFDLSTSIPFFILKEV